MSDPVSYRWQPIADFEDAPESLAKPELQTLAEIWSEQREALAASEGLKLFNERLRREWSIETGLIERVYTFDRGVTQMLIERGIDASYIGQRAGTQDPARIVAILQDHEEAIEGLFAFVKGQRDLTTSYVNELHAQLTRHQETTFAVDTTGRLLEVPLLHGAYKQWPNNPQRTNGSIHQYCPPEHVASEMDRLIAFHREHSHVPSEVEATWLHHRFTQIHPFQDGNGRVARCLATLVFIRAGYFPLVIRDTPEERTRYLDALERADRRDLEPLVSAFAASQRRTFVQALGISDQVLHTARAEQEVSAVRARLAQRERVKRAEWEKAKASAGRLQEVAAGRLQGIANRLLEETKSLITSADYFVDREPADGPRGHYFRWQIIETAKQLGYYANLAEYRSWTRLVMKTDSQAEILLSFHVGGREYRGLIAVSACFFRRDETEEGERQIAEVAPLSADIFQINYVEPETTVEARFRNWLEDVLVRGLKIWRAGL